MAHTCKSKATARRGLTRSTDARRGHTRLLGFRWGALLALLGSPHAQPHRHTHSHITSAQGKGARRTADGTADGERTREHLEAKKMPKKMKPNRVYMPAECGGVTTPLLPPAAWGGMGEGWVRGRRWDGRRGSYAAHLQSTRRRCRRGWTPKRGALWVERGWTPLPCPKGMRNPGTRETHQLRHAVGGAAQMRCGQRRSYGWCRAADVECVQRRGNSR